MSKFFPHTYPLGVEPRQGGAEVSFTVPDPYLKCCLCIDAAIADGTVDLAAIPDAVTLAPVFQTFTVAGQQVGGVAPVPVCLPCRKKQLGVTSKTGLVMA